MPTRSKTFDSHYPVTGDAIGTFPIHTDADVRVAVAQARIASDKWVALGFRGRKKVLLAWSKLTSSGRDITTRPIMKHEAGCSGWSIGLGRNRFENSAGIAPRKPRRY